MSANSPQPAAPHQPGESLAKLAVFGGQPTFENPLYVGRPNIGDRGAFRDRVNKLLDTRWLSNHGPLVREFEQRIADFSGVKHCVALCNATIALEVAARALDLRGEVIVPSFTFVATAHALQWQEITPVFCDIDPLTHTLDPRRVEALITARTSGVVGVHLWGQACAVEQLSEICQRRSLRLLFDAAHAFGCSSGGKKIGGFGDAEVYSFHATKFLNTFEGGAIVTNNDGLAKRLRLMTNFGFEGFDHVTCLGTNGKMTEISAAMGLTSLESMEEFIAINRRNYEHYREGLRGLPGLRVYPLDDNEKRNYQYVVVEVDPQITGLHRDWLIEVLHVENVIARRYFYPGVHRMEPYRSRFPDAPLLLPETEALAQRILVLPTGTAVGTEDIDKICGILRLCLENAADLRPRLEVRGRRCTPDLR